MSFQAYLDNVKAKTGKTPEDFAKLAARQGKTWSNRQVAQIRALARTRARRSRCGGGRAHVGSEIASRGEGDCAVQRQQAPLARGV